MAQTAKQKRLTLVKQADRAVASEFRRSKALRIVAVIAILAVAGLFFAALFGPTLPYKVASQAQASLTSADFLRQLEAQTDSKISLRNGIRAFANGENFYEAELAAIRNARHSVNIEAYIFHRRWTRNSPHNSLTCSNTTLPRARKSAMTSGKSAAWWNALPRCSAGSSNASSSRCVPHWLNPFTCADICSTAESIRYTRAVESGPFWFSASGHNCGLQRPPWA